jgi:hypothetical protein
VHWLVPRGGSCNEGSGWIDGGVIGHIPTHIAGMSKELVHSDCIEPFTQAHLHEAKALLATNSSAM